MSEGTTGARSGVMSFRVPQAEYDAIQQAAQKAGVHMSTYVRDAIARRIARPRGPYLQQINGYPCTAGTNAEVRYRGQTTTTAAAPVHIHAQVVRG